jgi:acid phosphatase (class A)
MRKCKLFPALVLLLAFCAVARADAKYLTPEDITATIAILSPPPADGSPEQQAEIQRLLDFQAKRTPEDVARMEKYSHLSPYLFTDILGDWFNKKDLPLTDKLMSEVAAEGKAVVIPAKKQFHRNRPFVTDSRITPALKETGFSYPSGHGTGGMTYALVLAEMFPEHKDALIARGKQIGEEREIAGVHYPSDVAAGQKIAAEIVKRLLANADFHAAMEKAIEECHADANAGK